LNEIFHTHHREFKLALRKKEEMVESILDRLREVPVHQTFG
jgi:hypothetical protein